MYTLPMLLLSTPLKILYALPLSQLCPHSKIILTLPSHLAYLDSNFPAPVAVEELPSLPD
ncbi:unnamed protein product [Hymenolepis diminuta]|uniref:Uncharacterized protein n=1 Tax=Hymenolepis diminuta TaxID=6216 RepID=A0A564YY80_HYMDI|nr:unnamed protein product [Hymenolepis diminuta]